MDKFTFSHHSSFRGTPHKEITDKEINNTLQLLATVTETSVNEIYIFDTNTFHFLYINKSAEKNLGYSLEEMKNFTPVDIYTKMTTSALQKFLNPLFESDNKFIKLQTKVRRKNFSSYYIQIIIKKILLPECEYFVASVSDITQQVLMQKELRKLATIDSLTGVYNRHKANEIIDEEIIRQNRYEGSFALLMLDIDYFKSVNDTYGHDVGDMILQELSRLILNNTRKSDKFARWGGEEFLLILPQTTAEGAFEYAQKLANIIDSYCFTQISHLTTSIGACIYEDNERKTELLKRVDEALYLAKERGRNRVVTKSKPKKLI